MDRCNAVWQDTPVSGYMLLNGIGAINLSGFGVKHALSEQSALRIRIWAVFRDVPVASDGMAYYLLEPQKTASIFSWGCAQSTAGRGAQAFKAGEVRFLVSTDLGARGLDISGLPYVVNMTLPDRAEDYIHRVGRVGVCPFPGHQRPHRTAGSRYAGLGPSNLTSAVKFCRG